MRQDCPKTLGLGKSGEIPKKKSDRSTVDPLQRGAPKGKKTPTKKIEERRNENLLTIKKRKK
jgi:hypothetical protein